MRVYMLIIISNKRHNSRIKLIHQKINLQEFVFVQGVFAISRIRQQSYITKDSIHIFFLKTCQQRITRICKTLFLYIIKFFNKSATSSFLFI